MNRHAAVNDAKAYWRQFVTAFYFENVNDVIGGLLYDLQEEGPTKDPIPRLFIQTKEGDRVSVLVSQERLKKALKEACPAIGDHIRIKYTGEADRAAPGMNKAKLFDLEVRRKGDPPHPLEAPA